MKNLSGVCRLSFVLFILINIALPANAQQRQRNFPDSIRVEFPDHNAIVVFEMRSFLANQSLVQNFPSMLQALLEHAKKGLTDPALLEPHTIQVVVRSPEEKAVIVTAEGHNHELLGARSEISITKNALPETQILLKDEKIIQLLPPGWKVLIQSKVYRVTVYAENFPALEKLTQESLAEVVTTIQNDPMIRKIGKKSILSRTVIQNNAIAFSKIHYSFPGDFIGLHAGATVGVLNEKIYPELNFKTALYFSDRFGSMRQRFELTYEIKFFGQTKAETGFSAHPNSFLSLSYSRNFRGNSERERWIGVGAGLLVHRSGDMFQGKTAKFYLETDIGSTKLNLVPEFYLTDDFKKFMFGLKLSYKF